MVAQLVPVLILGAIGGVKILGHSHDGHGVHLHASPTAEGARLLATQHRDAHELGRAGCGHRSLDLSRELRACGKLGMATADFSSGPSERDPAEDSDGVLISAPDHVLLVLRGTDAAWRVMVARPVLTNRACLGASNEGLEVTGSPGGLGLRVPSHRALLTVVDRLISTSGALLL